MSDIGDSNITKKLLSLQELFRVQLPEKLVAIEAVCESAELKLGNSEEIGKLYQLVHSLAGTSGTFGAVVVSTVAREFENYIQKFIDDPDLLSASDVSVELTKFEDYVVKLRQAEMHWHPTAVPFIRPQEVSGSKVSNLIYLAEDDELLAADLVRKLDKAGYQVKHFVNLSDFALACEKQLPAAIVMDVVFEEGNIAGAKVISQISKHTKKMPPVIFISVRDDVEARLAAARAGAKRYFCKPINVKRMIQTLDGLTEKIAVKPYRVLLVDDELPMLDYYAAVLESAGMTVCTLSDPFMALKKIADFKPDIIVLDVYMPKCSGTELARVIRQDDAWAFTPIMYLSTESNINRQLAAMELGGDEFLVKPVVADHFVAAVYARAKRSRWTNRLNRDLEFTLRENEYQLVTMDQHDIVSISDITGKIVGVNQKFCDISGYSREELIGGNHRILKSGQHEDVFYEELWETISQGKIWRGTICNRNKQGGLYWVESTIVPFLDEHGLPYKYVSARTDITARVTTEKEMRESEEKYRLLYELSEEPMWLIVGEEFINANNAAIEILEYKSAEEFTHAHPSELSPEFQADGQSSFEKANEMISTAFEKGYHRFEWLYKKQSGVIFPVDVSLTRIPYKGQFALFCVWRDITESKKAAEKIRESEERFSFAVEGAGDGVWDWDLQTNKVNYSSEWMKMLGYDVGDFPNNFDTFSKLVHPEDLPLIEKKVADYLSEKISEYSVEVRMHCKDGSYRWILSRGKVMLRDKQGGALRMTGIHSDITKRKEAEFALIFAREDAEKANHAKSQFLSNMSHELRTPMNAILGYGQLLKMDVDEPLTSGQVENVDEIIRACNHLLELVNDVLDLAKIEAGHLNLCIEDISFQDVLIESLQLIGPLAQGRHIKVSVVCDGKELSIDELIESEKHMIRADRVRLKQVMLNLLSNAVKYNSENGNLIVEFKQMVDAGIFFGVTDTGAGLTNEQQSQLFQSFVRVGNEDSEIEGTGIGLVITRNIVELMGGAIGVVSELGEGSTFWFELPGDVEINSQVVKFQ